MSDVRRRFAIIKWIPRLLMLGVILFSFYVGWMYSKGHDEKPPASQSMIESPGSGSPKAQQKNIDYSHFDK